MILGVRNLQDGERVKGSQRGASERVRGRVRARVAIAAAVEGIHTCRIGLGEDSLSW